MKTGFRGAFVISLMQTEVDGRRPGTCADLLIGREWSWSGSTVRVDGPNGILPLAASQDEADLRRKSALRARRIAARIATRDTRFAPADPELCWIPEMADGAAADDKYFCVTDGRSIWTITVLPDGADGAPLLIFAQAVPPVDQRLWITDHSPWPAVTADANPSGNDVICFTPGTRLLTPEGPRDVASLQEGDTVQTRDNGAAEILWIGQRQVTGARLMAMPYLRPVRLRRGALDNDVPDAGLLVSPDHRIVLRGARAQALFGDNEVLVAARDLVDDRMVLRDYAVKSATYIHLVLPRHEILFANGVATESFHPAQTDLAGLGADDRQRLFHRMPELADDPHAYGPAARRVLTLAEAAILRHDAGQMAYH